MDYEQKIQEERTFNESFQKSISFLDVVNDEWISFISSGKKYYDSIHKIEISDGEACIFCSYPYDKHRLQLIHNHFEHLNRGNKDEQISIEKELLVFDISKIKVSLNEDDDALFESTLFVERLKSSIGLINKNKELFEEYLRSKHLMVRIAETFGHPFR